MMSKKAELFGDEEMLQAILQVSRRDSPALGIGTCANVDLRHIHLAALNQPPHPWVLSAGDPCTRHQGPGAQGARL